MKWYSNDKKSIFVKNMVLWVKVISVNFVLQFAGLLGINFVVKF